MPGTYIFFVLNSIAAISFRCVILIPVHRNSLVRPVILFSMAQSTCFFQFQAKR